MGRYRNLYSANKRIEKLQETLDWYNDICMQKDQKIETLLKKDEAQCALGAERLAIISDKDAVILDLQNKLSEAVAKQEQLFEFAQMKEQGSLFVQSMNSDKNEVITMLKARVKALETLVQSYVDVSLNGVTQHPLARAEAADIKAQFAEYQRVRGSFDKKPVAIAKEDLKPGDVVSINNKGEASVARPQ